MKLEDNSTILTEDNEEDGWFTDKNGNRVHVDPETGQKDAGWGGAHNGETLNEAKEQSGEASHKVADIKDAPVIRPSGGRESFADFWKAHSELKAAAAATKYVQKHFVDGLGQIENPRGLPERTILSFTGRGARETGRWINPDKLESIPYLADIYDQGLYLGWSKDKKGTHSNVERFHYTGGKVQIKDGEKTTTYHVTLCAKEPKTEKAFRHHMIAKADVAEDAKEKPWKVDAIHTRAAQGFGSDKSDLIDIISNDSLESKPKLEFFDFTVEKVAQK